MDSVEVTALVATRQALHAVADWVLAPLRHARDGHIGLRVTPGGFGHDLARVEGSDLLVGDGRAALTTLAAAAAFAGVEPGRHSGVYEPVTRWAPDALLPVDSGASVRLAGWFAHGQVLLDELCAAAPPGDEAPAAITLWPEHLDLATTVGRAGHRVNVGFSAGDDRTPLPYLYVGPWNPVDRDTAGGATYWNEPYGASLAYEAALDRTRALAFVERGLALAP